MNEGYAWRGRLNEAGWSVAAVVGWGETIDVVERSPSGVRLLGSSLQGQAFPGGEARLCASAFVFGGDLDHLECETIDMEAFGHLPPRDLSTAGTTPMSETIRETFHYAGNPEVLDLSCRIIEAIGDGFDYFVLFSQFRPDRQFAPTHMTRTWYVPEGVGAQFTYGRLPCGDTSLKGAFSLP